MPCPATPQARPQCIHNSLSPASGKGWLTKGTLAPRGGKKESLDQCGGVRGRWALSCSNKTPRAPCWSPGGDGPACMNSQHPGPFSLSRSSRVTAQPMAGSPGTLFPWRRPIQAATSSQPLHSSLPTPDHRGGGGHISSAALLMGRVYHSPGKSEPTEGR